MPNYGNKHSNGTVRSRGIQTYSPSSCIQPTFIEYLLCSEKTRHVPFSEFNFQCERLNIKKKEISNSDKYHAENKRSQRNAISLKRQHLNQELNYIMELARSGIRIVKPQGTSKCKCPKAGACLASSRNTSGAGTKEETDVARLHHADLVPNRQCLASFSEEFGFYFEYDGRLSTKGQQNLIYILGSPRPRLQSGERTIKSQSGSRETSSLLQKARSEMVIVGKGGGSKGGKKWVNLEYILNTIT